MPKRECPHLVGRWVFGGVVRCGACPFVLGNRSDVSGTRNQTCPGQLAFSSPCSLKHFQNTGLFRPPCTIGFANCMYGPSASTFAQECLAQLGFEVCLGPSFDGATGVFIFCGRAAAHKRSERRPWSHPVPFWQAPTSTESPPAPHSWLNSPRDS